MNWFERLFAKPTPAPIPETKKSAISAMALDRAARKDAVLQEFGPYIPPPGVIPTEQRAKALAQDATPYDYVNQAYVSNYFPGYQYLAMLSQLPEYRKFSEVPAKDMTRKWVKLRSRGDGDKSEQIAQINAELERLRVRDLFRRVAELDGFFGRAQIYLDVSKPGGALARSDPDELASPLIISPAKVKKGGLKALRVIEPVWTYPSGYNASDPLAPNYYQPDAWFVMGKTVHRSRLLTFVSRPVPDLLKPTYNFGGLSMSQMAQPYVLNWLRTRDSVSDLIHSFSVSGLKTNLAGVLTGADDAQFFARAQLFNQMRDNRGLMMLDKDTEEFFQFNTPLSGLSDLQSQAQEQMSAVSNIPLVKLLGVTPSGLNASSEGEIQVYYDTLHALQETLFSDPLRKIIDLVQLSIFGDIDEDIVFEWESLYGMDEVEKSTVRKTDADRDAVLIGAGVISPDEARARLANDPESGYDSLEGEIDDDDGGLDQREDTEQFTDKVRVE